MNLVGWLMRLFRRDDIDLADNVTSPEEKHRQEENLKQLQRRADALRVRARLQRDGS